MPLGLTEWRDRQVKERRNATGLDREKECGKLEK